MKSHYMESTIGTVSDILLANPTFCAWDAVMMQNDYDLAQLAKVLNGELKIKSRAEFPASERLLGEWHFGMCSYNIKLGSVACKHACTYCYETPTQGHDRYGRPKRRLAIEELMPVDEKKVKKGFPRKEQALRTVIFFPSTSDVFAENARDYVEVAAKMINAQHDVMFTTKTTRDRAIYAIVELINAHPKVAEIKRHLRIFITITTDNNAILREYEPYAPTFEERIDAIKFLRANNFNVNIMMEPFLSDPVPLAKNLLPLLAGQDAAKCGIIAIGTMNYRPLMSFVRDKPERAAYLAELYSIANIRRIWDSLRGIKSIYYKKKLMYALLGAAI